MQNQNHPNKAFKRRNVSIFNLFFISEMIFFLRCLFVRLSINVYFNFIALKLLTKLHGLSELKMYRGLYVFFTVSRIKIPQ